MKKLSFRGFEEIKSVLLSEKVDLILKLTRSASHCLSGASAAKRGFMVATPLYLPIKPEQIERRTKRYYESGLESIADCVNEMAKNVSCEGETAELEIDPAIFDCDKFRSDFSYDLDAIAEIFGNANVALKGWRILPPAVLPIKDKAERVSHCLRLQNRGIMGINDLQARLLQQAGYNVDDQYNLVKETAHKLT